MNVEAIEWTTTPMGQGVSLFTYLVFAITLMVCANKLGMENSWFAFVPFLNLWYATQIADVDWWWALVVFVPCVGFFVGIWLMWSIFERRNKNPLMSLLMIFPCLNILAAIYVCAD
ncbi:MAG: DUF5684 domain-containing protein [Fimbriimonas sp.]